MAEIIGEMILIGETYCITGGAGGLVKYLQI